MALPEHVFGVHLVLMCKSNIVFTPALFFYDAMFQEKSSLAFLLPSKQRLWTIVTGQEASVNGIMKSSFAFIEKPLSAFPADRGHAKVVLCQSHLGDILVYCTVS